MWIYISIEIIPHTWWNQQQLSINFKTAQGWLLKFRFLFSNILKTFSCSSILIILNWNAFYSYAGPHNLTLVSRIIVLSIFVTTKATKFYQFKHELKLRAMTQCHPFPKPTMSGMHITPGQGEPTQPGSLEMAGLCPEPLLQ